MIRRTGSLALLLVVQLLAAGASLAADEAQKRYPLPGQGFFQLNVPKSWRDEVQQPKPGMPPTIAFHAAQGKPFDVLVTPLWRTQPNAPVPTKEDLRKRVDNAIDAVRNDAVEKDIQAIELQGASGAGYYFTVTDRAPKPGEYKFMTQGMLKVSDLVVTFTILTNDGQQEVTRAALGMLRTATNVQK